jgi:hypothetical protein
LVANGLVKGLGPPVRDNAAEARGRFFEPAPGRNWTVGITASDSF